MFEAVTVQLAGKNGRRNIILEVQLVTAGGREIVGTVIIRGASTDLNEEESTWISQQLKTIYNSEGKSANENKL